MTSPKLTHRMLSARLRLPVLAFAALVARWPLDAFARQPASPEATPGLPDWTLEDFEADGLLGPNSYQSPNYGYAIEWSDDWGFEGLLIAPVQTLGDASDRLYLARAAGEARLSFVSMPDDGRTLQQRYADVAEALPEQAEIVTTLSLGQSVIWVEQWASDDPAASPAVVANELRALDDGAALVIWLASSADEVEAAFADLGGVLLDGQPLFSGFQVSAPGA